MEEVQFLLSHKAFVACILLCLIIAGGCLYIKILKEEVTTAKAEKAVVVSDLAISQASVATLQTSIQDQNAAIAKLKTDADARVAAHQVEIAAATKKAESYKQQAADLMKRIANPAQSRCDAVNDLINSQIIGLTQ
jgi:chromosome segregation ATPase